MKIKMIVVSASLCASACGPKADTVQPEPQPAPVVEAAPAKPPAKPIPDGYHTLTPQMTVRGLDAALAFYEKALGAERLFAMAGPDGKTMHAEIKIGDSIVMLEEENVAQGMKSPLTLGGTSAGLLLYVGDADAAFAKAVEAGATATAPVDEMFWGDRYGELTDPYGHKWMVATHVEELTPEQMMERAALLFPPPGKAPKKAKAPKKGQPPAWKKIAGTPAASPIADGYHTVTPALTVDDAAAAIEFYKAAFGASELARLPGPDGRLMHAEIKVGDSIVMLSDESPMGSKSAKTLGGAALALHMYTTDVDGAFARAVGAKAREVMPVADMFWGDRYGAVVDAAGYLWGLATHVEDLSPEAMAERMKAAQAKTPAS